MKPGCARRTLRIEKVVATPAVGDAAAGVLNVFLRAAQIGNSMVGSLFAPLWPMVGLTPLTETQALFDRIESLRREVRQFTAPSMPRPIAPVAAPRVAVPKSRRGQKRKRLRRQEAGTCRPLTYARSAPVRGRGGNSHVTDY